MRHLSKINIFLALLLSFLIGSLFGLSVNLGWGLPLGTTLTLVVTVLGFGVAFYQSYATRRHNRLLVKPHLILTNPFTSLELAGYYTYSLKVRNVGLGPALIENYSLSIGDELEIKNHAILETLIKYANKHFKAKGKARCVSGPLWKDTALDKGEQKTLIEINFPRDEVSFMEARSLAKKFIAKLNAEIKYQCHYGNHFKVSLKTKVQPKLATPKSTTQDIAALPN